MVKILLGFPYLRKSWFLIHFQRIFSLDIKFWVDNSSVSVLEDYCATFFHPQWFLMRNPLSLKWFFPYRLCIISLWVLLILIPCLQHSEVWVNPYRLMDFFKCILFSVCSAYWICKFMFFAKFVKLSVILLFQYLNFVKLAC